MKWIKLIAICFVIIEIGALIYVADVQSTKDEYNFEKPVTWSLKAKRQDTGDFGTVDDIDKELLEFNFPKRYFGRVLQIAIEVENCVLEGVYTMGYNTTGRWGEDSGYDVVSYGVVNTITFEPINTEYLLLIVVTPKAWRGDIPIYSGSLSIQIVNLKQGE